MLHRNWDLYDTRHVVSGPAAWAPPRWKTATGGHTETSTHGARSSAPPGPSPTSRAGFATGTQFPTSNLSPQRILIAIRYSRVPMTLLICTVLNLNRARCDPIAPPPRAATTTDPKSG